MTTTMLSSNPSSSPSPMRSPTQKLFDTCFTHLYLDTIRQNIGIAAIYTTILALTVILPAFQKALEVDASFAAESSFHISAPPLFFIGLIAPILLSVTLFHYLHNRLAVDFYHSMPVSRIQLFLSRYLAGLSLLLIPIILCLSIVFVIYTAFLYPAVSFSFLLYNILFDLIFWCCSYLIIFTFSCLVAVTCSNVAESIIYAIGLNAAGSFLQMIFYIIISSIPTLNFSEELTALFSPYGLIFDYTVNYTYQNNPPAKYLIFAAVWLLAAAAALFLSLRFYLHFQSEWAQQWGRQTALSQIMKIGAGLFGVFLVFYFQFLGYDNNLSNALLAVFVGAPLGFLIVESATAKGFSHLYQNAKYIAVTLCIALIMPLCFVTDGFGAVGRIPNRSRIEEINFSFENEFRPFITYYDKQGSMRSLHSFPVTLTSETAMDLVQQIHQRGIEETNHINSNSVPVDLNYRLAPFGTSMNRTYHFYYPDFPLLTQLACLPEYVRQNEPVFYYSPETLGQIESYDKSGKLVASIPSDSFSELLEAVKTDLTSIDSEEISDFQNNPVCGYLSFKIDDPDLRVTSISKEDLEKMKFGSSSLPLRDSYHNTLRVLSSLQALPQNTVPDKADKIFIALPDSSDVYGIPDFSFGVNPISNYSLTNKGQTLFTVSDPELMQQIFSAASLKNRGTFCNQVYVPSEQNSYYSKLYIDNQTLLSILKDSTVEIPYLLSPSELNDVEQLQNADILPPVRQYRSYKDELENWELRDNSSTVSVAEFAREYQTDWLENKTPEQLEAMERTAFLLPDNSLLFYDLLLYEN